MDGSRARQLAKIKGYLRLKRKTSPRSGASERFFNHRLKIVLALYRPATSASISSRCV